MFSVLLIFIGIFLEEAIAVCDNEHLISGLTGTISSPNYPITYANNLDCYSYIPIASGHKIIITFSAFSTEVTHDWVTITCTSGEAFTSPRYSGSQIPAVLTIFSCNQVTVYFHTDTYATDTGFSLTYNITSVCDNRNYSGLTGTISSPYYPMAYANNLDCHSYISVLSGHTIIITFSAFTTQYQHDWVAVTCASGNVFRSPLYSGSEIPAILTISSCNLVNVSFHSDVSTTDTGFSLTYNITSVCDNRNYSGLTGTISSPYYPMAYANNLDCHSLISVLSGHTIIIRFSAFTTQYQHDWVAVTCASGNVFRSPLYSGSEIPAILTISSCNLVNVSFHSDVSTTDTGFSLTYNTTSDWPTEDNMTIIGDNNGQIRTPALLYCNVAANPPATYTWIDESNGIMTNGPTITVNHGGRYTCNASNIIRGQHYQQSKSVTVQVLEDETHQNTKRQVSILGVLLGVTVITTIILLAILLSRKCRQLKKHTPADVGHECDGNEHELRQRDGESYRYATGFGNSVDVAESENDDLDDIYDNLSVEK